jgi:hypothetical protein
LRRSAPGFASRPCDRFAFIEDQEAKPKPAPRFPTITDMFKIVVGLEALGTALRRRLRHRLPSTFTRTVNVSVSKPYVNSEPSQIHDRE